jgi:hypothetical protein
MKLTTIKKLSIPGLCILTENMNAYIISSNNILLSISQRIHKFTDVRDVIQCTDNVQRSLIYNSLYKEYKSKGYRITSHKPRNWSINISIKKYKPNARQMRVDTHKVFIELKNTYRTIVLGIFETRSEAIQWKNHYLFDIQYVICYNHLTRQWYEEIT